jgi:DNA-binding SARP family transcriptional activator/GAF domain-containing protein
MAAPGKSALDLANALDRVLLATSADAAELFLSTPGSSSLLLAAHRGRSPRAFHQIARFEVGQGFPGLVAQTGEPLVSLDLRADERYLRTSVKEQGFRSYLCVPVWGSGEFLGSLNVAFRRRDDALQRLLPALVDEAGRLGMGLELARLRAAEPIGRILLDAGLDATANLQRAAGEALSALALASEADCAAILLTDPADGTLTPAGELKLPQRLHRALTCAADCSRCPAVTERQSVVHSGPAREGSTSCGVSRGVLSNGLCVPLVAGGRQLGVVLLGWLHGGAPPIRHLSVMRSAVDAAGAVLHNALVAIHQQSRVQHLILPGYRQPAALSTPLRLGSERSGTSIPSRQTASSFLDLQCLGRFTILRNGLPVPPERFPRRRALTLLKILLTRYGKQVHREELMELLWPDADVDAASTLLNVTVHCLRRGLEPEGHSNGGSTFVKRNGDHYYLDLQSPHRLDSHEFSQAARQGVRLQERGSRSQAGEAYRRAVALYRGDFLEDEPYSDWCSAERQVLRELQLAALRGAARLRLDEGDLDGASTHYRSALEVDGTLEDVHLAMMELLWRSGRRDEALRQYWRCREILGRDLGIAPGIELEKLRRRIISEGEAAIQLG